MSSSPFNPLSLPQAGQAAAANEARGALGMERARGGASREVARSAPTSSAAASSAPTSVQQAIANAARATSVDFDYLVAQAQVESAMNPRAKAATSSASGLYQFIEATWLNTMKRHGSRFGLGDIAEQIGVTRSGSAYVANPQQRAAILSLRNDPEVASLMAAGLAEDNRAHLTPILGRQPEASELYLAHFLGAGGAGRFLSAMQSDPTQNAASLFRRPAAANRAVFFEPSGRPRSLSEVMNYLGAKIDRAMASAESFADMGGSADFTSRLESFRTNYPNASFPSGRDYGVPYLITAPEVLKPKGQAPVTGANRREAPALPAPPTIPVEPTLSVPGAPLPPAPTVRSRSMSSVLSETFQNPDVSRVAPAHSVKRIHQAYERLRSMGL